MKRFTIAAALMLGTALTSIAPEVGAQELRQVPRNRPADSASGRT